MTFALLTMLTASCFSAKADTSDYWYVYYNTQQLKMLTYYTFNVITIKSTTIKDTDSISVCFYRDTRCDNCETNLIVSDVEDAWVVKRTGKGLGNALTFSLAELVSYQKRTEKSLFQVSYFDDLSSLQARKPIIFTIELE